MPDNDDTFLQMRFQEKQPVQHETDALSCKSQKQFVKWISVVNTCNGLFVRHKVNQQYTFSISENSAHNLAHWCLCLELWRLVEVACFHCILCCLDSRIVMMYPSLIIWNVLCNKISVQLHRLQIFTSLFASTILHFLVEHSRRPACSDFLSSTNVRAKCLNRTIAYAYSVTVSSQLHDDSILHHHIFNSTTVFLQTASDGRPHRGLIFTASSASTSHLPSDWPWHTLAQLQSIQQSFCCVSAAAERSPLSKFYHCMMADFVKISHSVEPSAFDILNLEQTTCNLQRTRRHC